MLDKYGAESITASDCEPFFFVYFGLETYMEASKVMDRFRQFLDNSCLCQR